MPKVFLSIAIIASLFLSAWAFVWGYADLNALPARNTMTSWEQQTDFDEVAWQRAVKNMQKAYELNFGNASLSADLGRLYAWQALQEPGWSKHAHEHREKAIEYYLETIAKRPSWGLGWIMFAETKFMNQEVDQLAFDALEKAMVFGPWETDIQQKSLWLGMVLWSHLSDDLQTQMIRMIDRSLIQQPRYVMETASVFGGGWIVEPLLESRFLLDENQQEYFNRKIIRLSAYHWDQISNESQQQVKEITSEAIRINSGIVAKIAVETNASGLISVLLDGRVSLNDEKAVIRLETSVVQIGFSEWKHLTKSERNVVKKVVKKLFKTHPKSVPDIAVKVDAPWLISPLLKSTPLLTDKDDINHLQRQVIRLGLRHWEILSGDKRKEIKQTISQAVKSNARGVINIAVENGWGEKITSYLTRRSDLNYLFDRLNALEKEKEESSQ